jgi:hypothetical protein
MARARNIKPGFFKNELLVELPFEHRLLFVGLWTLADRAGRLEDRPVRVKMELFPADDVNVNAGLDALSDKGFILRYEVAGCKYIQILAWDKHQVPHVRESASVIPGPTTGTDKAMPEHNLGSAEPSPRSPDSLIPDSLIPDSREELEASPPATAAPSPPAEPKGPAIAKVTEHAIETFNASALVKGRGGLLSTVSRSVGRETRQAQVKRCLKTAQQIASEQSGSPEVGPEFWQGYWLAVGADDFHAGRQGGGKGHENWVPCFEFLTRKEVMLKIYDRATGDAA